MTLLYSKVPTLVENPPAGGSLRSLIRPQKRFQLAERGWSSLWKYCWKRISRWKCPRRWTLAEWHEEARAIGALAAYAAEADFARSGEEIDADTLFIALEKRVISAVWAQYRREQTQARYFPNGESMHRHTNPVNQEAEMEMIARLRSVVSRLDESTHQLLIKLYWENHKEMELAREMQVTRQAINKRKKFAVQRIGRLLGAEPQEVNGTNS